MTIEQEYIENGYKIVAGVDEAGRGPIAGPVVAASVVLPADFFCEEITDSKKLTEKKREYLFELIQKEAVYIGVGIISSEEIDATNILIATHKAMGLAVSNMDILPNIALVDGLPVKGLPVPHKAFVKGDSLVKSISAASIIAKVTRDHIMIELDKEYPEYGFKKHKGYGTKAHIEAVRKYGSCKAHRETFEPIRTILDTWTLF